jgi:hypothetical protein
LQILPFKRIIQSNPKRFLKKSLKITIFHLDMLQVGSQKYIWKFNFSFLFSYIVYSQIWLNHLMDDHHLEQLHLKIEIKKEKKRKK